MTDTRLNNLMLNTSQAAMMLGLSEKTLHRWRREGAGPVFLKLGPKTIRYAPADIDAYLTAARLRG